MWGPMVGLDSNFNKFYRVFIIVSVMGDRWSGLAPVHGGNGWGPGFYGKIAFLPVGMFL